MKSVVCSVLVVVTCLALLAAVPDEKAARPQYDQKGQLIRPADYREWMFLSAGYGMNYSPGPDSHEMFTNVFVQRWADDEFAKSGKWTNGMQRAEVPSTRRATIRPIWRGCPSR